MKESNQEIKGTITGAITDVKYDIEENIADLEDKVDPRQEDKGALDEAQKVLEAQKALDPTHKAIAILRALRDESDRPRQTAKRIGSKLQLTEDQVERTLNELKDLHLVSPSSSEAGGWRIRSLGRTLLEEIDKRTP